MILTFQSQQLVTLLILQSLKEKFGYRLVNNEARSFKEFLNNYSTVSGMNLWNGDLKQVHDADFVVSIGSAQDRQHVL